MSDAPPPPPIGISSGVGDGNVGHSPSSTPAMASSNPKQRSCVTCRARKVRCNKASPCNHCQRAGIACVFPTPDRTPRWARRLNQQTRKDAASKTPRHPSEGAVPLMDRLHKLESLVRELSSQLHQEQESTETAKTVATQTAQAGSSEGARKSPDDTTSIPDTNDLPSLTRNVDNQFGRLVLDDGNRTRYVSNGFWSRINDELDSLRMETGALADEESELSDDGDSPGKSSVDPQQAATQRHAFLFGHNISSPNSSTQDLHPSPSQVPLMLAIFTRNVNVLCQIVHTPTVMRIVQDRQDNLSHANEALLFAIYYATIASMEEEDVMNMLGASRQSLARKYRFCLEHALAKADFLNVPDLTLVQAFCTYLFLLRRDESPRYVWMMTGMVLRMALSLGLHRDGAKLKHLTPYDIEIRRRVWWALLCLDMRSSEDQGSDLTIAPGTFDTLMPSNINDLDLDPSSNQSPLVRPGFTDMTFALLSYSFCRWTREMMSNPPNPSSSGSSLSDIEARLDELYTSTNDNFLRLTVDLPDMSHWIGLMVLRLVISKMTLILYLPELFSTPPQNLPADFRTKLFMSALEVAEINHALMSEPKCRHWRWLVQTYTQWHAIVVLLLEVGRREWSATVERAWDALQSEWLIPSQGSMDRSLRVWIPLRGLIAKGRRWRGGELERLRGDGRAARGLEVEDERVYVPPRGGGVERGGVKGVYRERWRRLVGLSGGAGESGAEDKMRLTGSQSGGLKVQNDADEGYMSSQAGGYTAGATGQALTKAPFGQPADYPYPSLPAMPPSKGPATNIPPADNQPQQQTVYPDPPTSQPTAQIDVDQTVGNTGTFEPWLWTDSDPVNNVLFENGSGDIQLENVDFEVYNNVDWMDWLGTARDVEIGKLAGQDAWGEGA